MKIKFDDIEEIKNAGFSGFKRMSELFVDSSAIPRTKGIYLVLYLSNLPPEFTATGSGGYFKGKNPNISLAGLESNWVNNTIVVYIGKGGKDGSKATINSRLQQYFKFGQGGNVGHYGGRLIWQIKNSRDLVVCWKELPNQDPKTIESQLIQQFYSLFSVRPFANLMD
jgi:hypothetical protein